MVADRSSVLLRESREIGYQNGELIVGKVFGNFSYSFLLCKMNIAPTERGQGANGISSEGRANRLNGKAHCVGMAASGIKPARTPRTAFLGWTRKSGH